ncbi:MAG: 3'(2'),5'-bisphosphate nucleotidase CysQ [Steroidobacteraceae bacterium]
MTTPFYKTAPDRTSAGLAAIAWRAGTVVMEVYRSDFVARMKADDTPVTLADQRAEALILPALARLLPGVPVVSEESFDAAGTALPANATFLLVDPLDGTREFLKRNGEFTVNIALIEAGRPTAGCVYAPAVGEMYFAGTHAYALAQDPDAAFDAAIAQPIEARAAPASGAVALVSRSHRDPDTERFLAGVEGVRHESIGSSLKFCRIAAGRADLYPRFGATMEWDVAAGHAVLQAAGGSVTTPEGAPFSYGKFARGLRNGPFIARGRRP